MDIPSQLFYVVIVIGYAYMVIIKFLIDFQTLKIVPNMNNK